MNLNIMVNGKKITAETDGTKPLIDFLRDDLKLKGAKEGCGEGECGACTIILNGNAVTACTLFTGQINGKEIITIEGLAKNGELDILQKTFIKHGAIQCGFCSPGMILSAKSLLMKTPHPTDFEIKRAIEGNLCRCTGYQSIIEAIKELGGMYDESIQRS